MKLRELLKNEGIEVKEGRYKQTKTFLIISQNKSHFYKFSNNKIYHQIKWKI